MDDKTTSDHFAQYEGYEAGRPLVVRAEHAVIIDMVAGGSSVVDLGCGDGGLGKRLMEEKQCRVSGIEVSKEGVDKACALGIDARAGDLDTGLPYDTNSFDYGILAAVLEHVYRPGFVLEEALRVSRKLIVALPNVAHAKSRLQLLLGRFPRKMLFGQHWYDTRHIHLFSLKDIREFLGERNAKVLKTVCFGRDNQTRSVFADWFPNLFGTICTVLINSESFTGISRSQTEHKRL